MDSQSKTIFQSKTQEISHILPGEHLNVFNVVRWDMGDVIAKWLHGAKFAPRIHMLHKPAGGMKICKRQSYSIKQKKYTGTMAEDSCKHTRTKSTTIISASTCTTF